MTRARDNSFNPFNNQVAGKNFIINGGMDFWQRGTSISRGTYAETFLADRWYASAGAAFVVSRESTIVPAGFQYSQKLTGNGSSTPDPFFSQMVETANTSLLAGQTVTMSAYIYSTSTSPVINLLIGSSTVVDDTRSGWTGTNLTAIRSGSTTASPSWNRISSTFVIPTNSKTLLVQVQCSAAMSSSNSFYFTGVQLELGSTPTVFSRAGGTIGGELSLCQRYYEKSYDINVTPSNIVTLSNYALGKAEVLGLSGSANTGSLLIRYNVVKRTTPTVSSYAYGGSPTSGTTSMTYNIHGVGDYSDGSLQMSSEKGFMFQFGTSNSSYKYFGWTASSEL